MTAPHPRMIVVLDRAVRREFDDRAEAHGALRKLRFDRAIGIERIGHAVDNAGFENWGRARFCRRRGNRFGP